MRDHLKGTASGARWRYLINTAGQAFPLRTNEEIVSILRLYNGTNDIEGNLNKVLARLIELTNLKCDWSFALLTQRWV